MSHLIIGFAFSLMPDGAPGSYNLDLARRVVRDIDESPLKSPFLALQWEIADALWDLEPKRMSEWEAQNRLFVVSPPRISAQDVQGAQLKDFLSSSASPFCAQILRAVKAVEVDEIHGGLNDFLDDPLFFRKFSGLDLVNLERAELGDLFTEHRSLPKDDAYQDGLRRYQKLRINRLILESVIPDPDSLRRGRYLSTPGVLEAVLEQCFYAQLKFDRIRIFAHPEHAARCRQQTQTSLEKRGLDTALELDRSAEGISWDSTTAQVWCRSQSNWDTYEARVQQWLAALSSPGK